MPTFILHGGLTTKANSSNKAFYTLMAQAVPAGGTWLGCYFASLSEKEAAKFAADTRKLKRAAKHKFKTVMADAATFPEQLQTADVIYFAGGSTRGLMNQTRQWPQLKSWLQNAKVVAGSSAGMNLLGEKFLTKDAPHHGQGLGLIPFNMLVHHKAPEYAHIPAPAAPCIALQETQFCVIEM